MHVSRGIINIVGANRQELLENSRARAKVVNEQLACIREQWGAAVNVSLATEWTLGAQIKITANDPEDDECLPELLAWFSHELRANGIPYHCNIALKIDNVSSKAEVWCTSTWEPSQKTPDFVTHDSCAIVGITRCLRQDGLLPVGQRIQTKSAIEFLKQQDTFIARWRDLRVREEKNSALDLFLDG